MPLVSISAREIYQPIDEVVVFDRWAGADRPVLPSIQIAASWARGG